MTDIELSQLNSRTMLHIGGADVGNILDYRLEANLNGESRLILTVEITGSIEFLQAKIKERTR